MMKRILRNAVVAAVGSLRLAALLFAVMVLVSGCNGSGSGSGLKDQAAQVINEGMAKESNCAVLPIGGEPNKNVNPESQRYMRLLQEGGLITPAQVKSYPTWNKVTMVEGFEFTEAAKPLIQRPLVPGDFGRLPCVRLGHFEVRQVEAVDQATDREGRTVVNARVRLRFVAEAWTKEHPADTADTPQYLFALLKSGDRLFFTGEREALK
jgi:hypothetical protein